MAEDWEQLRKQGASEFSDDVIRRFLLGNLRDDERPLFEARLFTDDELGARVGLVEFDLSDDYAFARLAPADRELFGRNFLVTTERRRALGVSRSLHDRFAIAAHTDLRIVQRLKQLFIVRQPFARYAFAALIVIVLIATVWLAIKEPRFVKRFLPRVVAPKPSVTATPQPAHHSSNASPTHTHTEPAPELPAHKLPIVAAVIEPNGSIENAPTLHVPKDDRDVVLLQLLLEKNPARAFQAEVSSLRGESVFSAGPLVASDDSKINLEIPARLLSTGDYQVKLSRMEGKSKRSVANYYFRVQ